MDELIQKEVNVCITTGGTGTGKKLLLDAITTDKKILVLDDTYSIKKSLVYMLVYLLENDMEAVSKLLFKDFDTQAIITKLNHESISNLCEEVKRLVVPKQYVFKDPRD